MASSPSEVSAPSVSQTTTVRDWALDNGYEPVPPKNLDWYNETLWSCGLFAESLHFRGFKIQLTFQNPLHVTPDLRRRVILDRMEALGGAAIMKTPAKFGLLEKYAWTIDSFLRDRPEVTFDLFSAQLDTALLNVSNDWNLEHVTDRHYGFQWWLHRYISVLPASERMAVSLKASKILLVLLVSGCVRYYQPSRVAAAALAHASTPDEADKLSGFDFFDYTEIYGLIEDLASMALSLPDEIHPQALKMAIENAELKRKLNSSDDDSRSEDDDALASKETSHFRWGSDNGIGAFFAPDSETALAGTVSAALFEYSVDGHDEMDQIYAPMFEDMALEMRHTQRPESSED